MIFVSVGTHEAPFDRMLRAVYSLDLDEELVVQHGSSSVRSERASVEVDYLTFDEVVSYIRDARAVVMHAGVGSVMISLANGKRPIVMARRRQFREHVDDHQVELARRMSDSGLATFVGDDDELADALTRDRTPNGALSNVPWLGFNLQAYLLAEIGKPKSAAGDSLQSVRRSRVGG
jgi:UDP-N-acetylglucosamine transferase subunit ALG13